MISYLIDTNIIIDYLRQKRQIVSWLNTLSQPKISLLTAAELYHGVRNKKELKNIKELIKYFKVILLNEKISFLALQFLEKYFLTDKLLIIDALIAATAIENGLFLITNNVKHFKMIKGLRLQAKKSF